MAVLFQLGGTRRSWFVWGLTALVVSWAGCATPSKNGGEPAAAPPEPAPPPTRSDTPTAESPTTTNLEQALREMSASDTGETSEAQREALVQMIQAAIAAQIQASEQEARPEQPAPRQAPAQPATPAQPAAPAESEAAAAQAPPPGAGVPARSTGAELSPTAQSDKGCGPTERGHVVDLTPPRLDEPQPKFVCRETKLVSAGVWQGETAEFTFQLANEGEGPLNIRLRGG